MCVRPVFIYYHPQTKFAKDICSQVSVCPCGEKGVCHTHPPGTRGRHPLGPEADTPRTDTPRQTLPPGQTPPGQTPPRADTPLGRHPPYSACWDQRYTYLDPVVSSCCPSSPGDFTSKAKLLPSTI